MRMALLAGAVLLLTGCQSGTPNAAPERVLRRYLDAVAAHDFDTAYAQLAEVDRAVRRPGEFRPRPVGEYRITRVRTFPDIATVDVEITVPAAPATADAPGSDDADPGAPPPGPQLQSFTLVREQQRWKVFLGAAAAADLNHAGESGAQMPDDMAPAPTPLPPTGAVRPDVPDAPDVRADPAPRTGADGPADAAAQGIEVYGLKAGYYRTALGRRVPGAEFRLRNRSNRTATHVTVTVYFHDRAGNTIAEETYYPVRSDGAGFLNTAPLRPGYRWQVERGRFLLAESVPDEWHTGAVSCAVTQVRFAAEEGRDSDRGEAGEAGVP